MMRAQRGIMKAMNAVDDHRLLISPHPDACRDCGHPLDDHIPKYGCGRRLPEPVKFGLSHTSVCPCLAFR